MEKNVECTCRVDVGSMWERCRVDVGSIGSQWWWGGGEYKKLKGWRSRREIINCGGEGRKRKGGLVKHCA